jgi:hypothetical protein
MTAIDTVAYSVGAKSEVQGSGAFSSFVLKNNAKDRAIGLAITASLVALFVTTAQSKGYI